MGGGAGGRLHLRLFLDGIEIPVVGANVTTTINAPARAQIRIIPTDLAKYIQPRTTVQLFYYDYTGIEIKTEDSAERASSGVIEADLLDITSTDPPNDAPLTKSKLTADTKALLGEGKDIGNMYSGDVLNKYRVLFKGEVSGWQWSKSAQGNRVISLECLDDTNYFDFIYQTYLNVGSIAQSQMTMFLQGQDHNYTFLAAQFFEATNWITRLFSPGGSPFLLDRYKVKFQGINGLLAGFVRIIAAVSGVDPGPAGGRILNIFFREALLRNRILDQVYAAENDDTAIKLMETTVFFQSIQNTISELGANQATLRDMLKLSLTPIYYTHAPITTPYYNPDKDSLYTLMMKPELFFAPPPSCNLIFPDEYTSVSYARNYLAEPTRLLVQERATVATGGAGAQDMQPMHFAPATTAVIESVKKIEAGQNIPGVVPGSGAFSKFLSLKHPHEQFTGPIPVWQSISQYPSYTATKAAAGQPTPHITDTANYEFYKMRFGTRMANVTAKFLPRLVCGLPAAVIDKPVLQSELDESHPSHLLGSIITLTHSVDAVSGGTTSFTLEKVRMWDESLSGYAVGTEGQIYKFLTVTNARLGTAAPTVIPIEKIIAPKWLDKDVYGNENIGPKFYAPLLGCGSMIDSVKVGYLDEEEEADKAREVAETVVRGIITSNSGLFGIEFTPGETEDSDILFRTNATQRASASIHDADSPLNTATTVGEFRDALTAELSNTPVSINKSIEVLADAYSRLSRGKIADIQNFINTITFRPIAKLLDIIDPEAITASLIQIGVLSDPIEEATSILEDIALTTAGEVNPRDADAATMAQLANEIRYDDRDPKFVSGPTIQFESDKLTPKFNVLYVGRPFARAQTEGDPVSGTPVTASTGAVEVEGVQVVKDPVLKARQTIILKYRRQLIRSRGFVG
ncbi:hypothetical protein LCGC14_0147630 [marine sediment metagenome]|uniref:Uncharacterized protein n=1 Tax=marine sediment metagenome TaxID=412755 RepID=A0A0F9XHR0_9ZZZZ